MKYMYYCPNCKKVFKAGETGKNIKCPKCESSLLDLGISDQDYAILPAAEKEIMKQNMTVKVNSNRLGAAISNNREMLAQIKNNYLKMQIQNQTLPSTTSSVYVPCRLLRTTERLTLTRPNSLRNWRSSRMITRKG